MHRYRCRFTCKCGQISHIAVNHICHIRHVEFSDSVSHPLTYNHDVLVVLFITISSVPEIVPDTEQALNKYLLSGLRNKQMNQWMDKLNELVFDSVEKCILGDKRVISELRQLVYKITRKLSSTVVQEMVKSGWIQGASIVNGEKVKILIWL